MRCKICQNEFTPSRYRPTQQVCSGPECQKLRQIQNEQAWRAKNPDYFKYLGGESAWHESRRRYNKLWRQTHKEYLKTYAEEQKTQRREYMRQYMREYRKAKTVNRDKS